MEANTSKLIKYNKKIIDKMEKKYISASQKQLKLVTKVDKLKFVLTQTLIICIKEVIKEAEKKEDFEECQVMLDTLDDPDLIESMLQIWWATGHKE